MKPTKEQLQSMSSQDFLNSLACYDPVKVQNWLSPHQKIELHTEADLTLCYQSKLGELQTRLGNEGHAYGKLKLNEQIKRVKSYLKQSQKRMDQLCQIAIREEELSFCKHAIMTHLKADNGESFQIIGRIDEAKKDDV